MKSFILSVGCVGLLCFSACGGSSSKVQPEINTVSELETSSVSKKSVTKSGTRTVAKKSEPGSTDASAQDVPAVDSYDVVLDGKISLRSDLSNNWRYRDVTGVWFFDRRNPEAQNFNNKVGGKMVPVINGLLVIEGLKPLEYSCYFVDKQGVKVRELILDFTSIPPNKRHKANPEIIY